MTSVNRSNSIPSSTPLPTADEPSAAPLQAPRARSHSAPPVLARPHAPASQPGLGLLGAARFEGAAASAQGADAKVRKALQQLNQEKNIGVLDSAIEHFANVNPKNQKAIVDQFIRHIDVLGAENAQDLEHLDCLYEGLGALKNRSSKLTTDLVGALFENGIGNPPQEKWATRLGQTSDAICSLIAKNSKPDSGQDLGIWAARSETLRGLSTTAIDKVSRMAPILDKDFKDAVADKLSYAIDVNQTVQLAHDVAVFDTHPQMKVPSAHVGTLLSFVESTQFPELACSTADKSLKQLNRYEPADASRALAGIEAVLRRLADQEEAGGTATSLLAQLPGHQQSPA